MGRPYVIASAAMSVDGRLDDASSTRLLLSGPTDRDRVDDVRATVDAILVGAATIRHDDPRLLVRSNQRRRDRHASGRSTHPMKVTLTASGDLPEGAAFFAAGNSARMVYAASSGVNAVTAVARNRAHVVDMGEEVDLLRMLEHLYAAGVRRLLVEGGSRMHTAFLTASLVDELQLVVAPFFVGESRAPRFVYDGSFPHDVSRPMRLVDVRQLDDDVLLHYRLEAPDAE